MIWTPEDFDYDYPVEAVATSPAMERSGARLLVCERQGKKISSRDSIRSLAEEISPRSCLVINETKVLAARFKARKDSGASLEGLFLGESSSSRTRVWLKGSLKAGQYMVLENGPRLKLLRKEDKEAELDCSAEDFKSYLREYAYPALPPYIRKARKWAGLKEEAEQDKERYQSTFVRNSSAAEASLAAPTASLHFDEELLKAFHEREVEILRVELQVGLGTFEPLRDSVDLAQQSLHTERYHISPTAWEGILRAKAEARPLIAVGTTSLRALESAALSAEKRFLESFEETSLFVRPGFLFQMTDSLITNFHQPKSSLLVLVASFLETEESLARAKRSGGELWRLAYRHALKEKFRLFSFGDAMWIR